MSKCRRRFINEWIKEANKRGWDYMQDLINKRNPDASKYNVEDLFHWYFWAHDYLTPELQVKFYSDLAKLAKREYEEYLSHLGSSDQNLS